MKFADYIGMLAESVEELTFEKILDAVKNGKEVFYKNRKFDVRLDPSVPKGFTICALYPEDVAPGEQALGVPSKEVFYKNYKPTEFYISRKPIYESVEELTFEKLKKELKIGKKFHWKNKGYEIVLDKNGKVLVGWDVGGKKENWVGLDKDNFEEYSEKIFEAGKKLDEELDNKKYFSTKVNIDKLVATLKEPLSSNVKKLNPREKEMFEGFRDIFSRIVLLGKYPSECTEYEGEIFKDLGFKVSGKVEEGPNNIYYTKIFK